MAHDWININSNSYATLNEMLAATGRCGLALYADLPILSDMYTAMTRFSVRESVVDRLLEEHFSGIGRTWRMFASQKRMYPVDLTVARVSIHKAFGILPDQQESYEEQFRAMKFSPNIKQTQYSTPTSRVQYYLD